MKTCGGYLETNFANLLLSVSIFGVLALLFKPLFQTEIEIRLVDPMEVFALVAGTMGMIAGYDRWQV